MGTDRYARTTRELATMRRAGLELRRTDTHTADGRRKREPRPAPRRQGTRAAVVADAVREG